MKRSKTQLLRSLAAMMLLSAGVASCSQDDMPQAGDTPLPDGEYPLTFTARVDGMNTRTAGKDAWTEGDEIGVRIGTDGATGRYKLNGNGGINEAITPVYWQNTAPATVTAWYPYTPQNGVNISNQSAGFANFDFLTATAPDQSYQSSVSLEFKHRMAKVSYTLQKGDGVTDDELKRATVILMGNTTATFEDGVLSPADTENNGEITSCYDNDNKTGAALLVPQNMTNKPFIKVRINGQNFTYTPSTETAGNLKAGCHNTYTITVKKDRIEVASISASWNENVNEGSPEEAIFRLYLPEQHGQTLTFSQNVTEKDGYLEVEGNQFTISYAVTDQNRMKGFLIDKGIGKMVRTMSDNGYTFTYTPRSDLWLTYGDYAEARDYYYSDGTWSPDYISTKTCIGIVFKSGAGEGDDISAYENKLTAIHGYVVALNDAHDQAGAWGIRGRDENLPNESSYTPKYNGYANTAAIRKVSEYANTDVSRPTAENQYWAFRVASEYNVAAPSGSSGWYLPSIGQLADIYSLPDRAGLFAGANGADFISETNDGRYWSSTEQYNLDAWYYQFNGSGAGAYAKEGGYLNPSYVRAVLTF